MVVTRDNKRKKQLMGNGKEDRKSELPVVLLHHILSFMDTIDVVRTCVSSKRWRYLWTSLDNLEFTYKILGLDSDGSKMLFFTNFINQVLLRRNCSPIIKFQLSDIYVKASIIESFICYAVKHQVQDLDIYVSCSEEEEGGPFKLPPCFFTCDSLTTLKLHSCNDSLYLPASMGLKCLKTLHLINFGDFDGNIFSTCPQLETLLLERIFFIEIQHFNINAPNLKILEFLDIIEYDDRKIMIFAPKLTKFKFVGDDPLVCSTNKLSSSLEEVDNNLRITFDQFYPSYQDEMKHKYCLYLVKMLNEFHSAKSISLSLNTIKVLSVVPETLNQHPSQFSNLKYLKLKTDKRCNRANIPDCVLAYFLKISPSLIVHW